MLWDAWRGATSKTLLIAHICLKRLAPHAIIADAQAVGCRNKPPLLRHLMLAGLRCCRCRQLLQASIRDAHRLLQIQQILCRR